MAVLNIGWLAESLPRNTPWLFVVAESRNATSAMPCHLSDSAPVEAVNTGRVKSRAMTRLCCTTHQSTRGPVDGCHRSRLPY